MLATVVWIGGLTALAFFVLPAGRRALDDQAYADLLGTIQRRLDPLGWFSMVVLVGSGLVQMSANPNYQGFLAVNNRWAAAILVKHLLFGLMVVVSAYLTWGLIPAIRRSALRRAQGAESPDEAALRRRETLLLRVNVILGVVVLALTALARSS